MDWTVLGIIPIPDKQRLRVLCILKTIVDDIIYIYAYIYTYYDNKDVCLFLFY